MRKLPSKLLSPGAVREPVPHSEGFHTVTPASIVIVPMKGYHVGAITDNQVSMLVANPYAIENVTAIHNVVVTFAR
jgi:hypothetical protein